MGLQNSFRIVVYLRRLAEAMDCPAGLISEFKPSIAGPSGITNMGV